MCNKTKVTKGITCLINSHQLNHALHFGDRLIALQHGKMIQNYSATEKASLTLNQIQAECY